VFRIAADPVATNAAPSADQWNTIFDVPARQRS
jgi:hypothetical protein